MIAITIDSRLRLPLADLSEEVAIEIESKFVHKNPAHAKAQALGYRYTKEPRTIITHRREQDSVGDWWLSLPRGGMTRVIDVLEEASIEMAFDDQRTNGADLGSYTGDWVEPVLFPDFKTALWKHQVRLVDAVIEGENCLARSPTGSGKSIALLAAIKRINLPAIVVMNDGKLLKQWQACVLAELGIPIKNQGIIQGKKKVLRPITLAMQQTLWKMSDADWARVLPAFGVFALDESQFTAAKTVLGVVDRFPARFRIGISADETRRDRKDFLTYDVFGDVAIEITKDELVKGGYIHDVSVRVVPTDFECQWYLDAKEDPKKIPSFNDLLVAMIGDNGRNDVIRRVVAGIAQEQQPSLVFSHRVEHCRLLDSAFAGDGHSGGLLLGGPEHADEFIATKRGIIEGNLLVGTGTYKAIGTGQDIPNVVNGVATTPIHMNRQFLNQVKGRICRRSGGKTAARLYYIWDQHVYGPQAIRSLARWTRDVKIWSNGKWVDARAYLEENHGNKAKRRRSGGPPAGPFVSADDFR